MNLPKYVFTCMCVYRYMYIYMYTYIYPYICIYLELYILISQRGYVSEVVA